VVKKSKKSKKKADTLKSEPSNLFVLSKLIQLRWRSQRRLAKYPSNSRKQMIGKRSLLNDLLRQIANLLRSLRNRNHRQLSKYQCWRNPLIARLKRLSSPPNVVRLTRTGQRIRRAVGSRSSSRRLGVRSSLRRRPLNPSNELTGAIC
jgi:hypothetical protein